MRKLMIMVLLLLSVITAYDTSAVTAQDDCDVNGVDALLVDAQDAIDNEDFATALTLVADAEAMLINCAGVNLDQEFSYYDGGFEFALPSAWLVDDSNSSLGIISAESEAGLLAASDAPSSGSIMLITLAPNYEELDPVAQVNIDLGSIGISDPVEIEETEVNGYPAANYAGFEDVGGVEVYLYVTVVALNDGYLSVIFLSLDGDQKVLFDAIVDSISVSTADVVNLN